MVRQQVRQPVSSLVEFSIGHRQIAGGHRHRLRGAGHLCGKQLRNRHRNRRGPGQHRAVAYLIEPGVLVLIEHIHRRQPPGRVSGHRHQHPPQPLHQGFDAGRVEHVGAEFHHPGDSGGRTRLTPPFGQRKRQVHPGGARVERHRSDLQVTQG